MSKTVTAEAVENLNKISNTTPDVETRVTRNILVGQCVQQGDVYVHRVNDTHTRGKMRGSRQVAVGETTRRVQVYWQSRPCYYRPGSSCGRGLGANAPGARASLSTGWYVPNYVSTGCQNAARRPGLVQSLVARWWLLI
jgi:hypothetical protein